ncbi:MAG: acyltransferase [Spirochaetes bacterium]|nr:acyltransferase [Spirochaetota bacterium]
MSTTISKNRLNYVDWLRITAVLLLFPYHTGRIFCSKYFYVKNETVSAVATFIVTFIGQWHMHLFMLLAGVGTFYAMKHRNPGEYIRERFLRLVVPLAFGIFVLIPPLAYFRLFGNPDRVWPAGFSHGAPGTGYSESYFSFYPNFFNGMFPRGNMEWGHLWFLAYLFTFSLIAVPVFMFLKSEKGKNLIDTLARCATKKFCIFLFVIPIVVIEVSLRRTYPGVQNLIKDWANFLTYFTVFVSGYIIMADRRFLEAIDRIRGVSLVIGMAMNAALVTSLDLHTGNTSYSSIVFSVAMIVKSIAIWSILLGLIGMGRRYLDRGGRFLGYAQEAAMPYYVLHQTAVMTAGFYIVKLDAGVAVQYIAIMLSAFVAVAVVYEVALRRIPMLGFFVGMKLKRRSVAGKSIELEELATPGNAQ